MLHPIHRAQLTSQFEPLSTAKRGEVLFLESSITSVRTQPIEYKKRILEILNSIWSFIKVYFLFLCFDSSDGNREKLRKQLRSFISLYFEATKKGKVNESEKIIREFGNLSKILQEDVKQEIEKVYREAFPNKSSEYYKNSTRDQLRDPFNVINKGEGEREIQVFGKALLMLQNRYLD